MNLYLVSVRSKQGSTMTQIRISVHSLYIRPLLATMLFDGDIGVAKILP